MAYKKLATVLSNFDEYYLKNNLLGELQDSLIEWSFGSEMLLKSNIIDIIIAVSGMNLFKDEEFRYKFFLSSELSDLKTYAEKANFSSDELSYEDIAKKLSKIKYEDNSLYQYLIRIVFEDDDFEFEKKDDKEKLEKFKFSGKKFFELYDYQYMIKQQAINDLEDPDKGLYKILLHMPTGTGKTKTTMHIISHYINFISKGQGLVVWIAHTNELLLQAYETFCNVWGNLGLNDINIYKGWNGYPEKFENGILFTSIQSLVSKMKKEPFDYIDKHASLIIFDEVHKAGAEKYSECIDSLMTYGNEYGKRFIGLTATPGRTTDISKENALFSSSFDRIIGIDVDKVNSISLSENEAANYNGNKDVIRYFQDRKILSKIDRTELDFSVDDLDESVRKKLEKELKGRTDDFSDDLLNKIALNTTRNAKIMENLQYLYDNKISTIVFACSLKHAKMLAAFLKLNNIDCSLVYGDMDNSSRKAAIDNFKNGKVNFIINYDILTTGFDSTNIKCVFITRPTKSVILYSQMIGRGLRGPKMGGNETCKLIDVKENLEAFNENDAFKHFDKYWR